ncbi:MAG: hypothetical protein GX107_04960 [Clostridiales bacterium]|nr:hypothetical protein [Clostridiales bacterium]
MCLKDKIFAAGVVGCGGAGFPTHVKLAKKVEYLIINGAECEPLLRTDRYIMTNFADEIVSAAEAVRNEVGANLCVIALKQSYKEEISALQKSITAGGFSKTINLHFLETFYPAGDEHIIVREVTGRVIPPSGIPLDVGCVVLNAATMLCVHGAMKDEPFTDKFLTVTGEVNTPAVQKVPIGTLFSDCIEKAGGAKTDDYIIISGGPMMGKVITREQSHSEVVTKTTSGIIVLKKGGVIEKTNAMSIRQMLNRARSSCIQCNYCTQMCPRYLLGHPIEPHMIMRKTGLNGSLDGLLADRDIQNAVLCCECGVCEVYACPMGLQPRRINSVIKAALAEAGIKRGGDDGQKAESKMRDLRKIPTKRAAARAGVVDYYDFDIKELIVFEPTKAELLLSQHIGAPSVPVVRDGDKVAKGQTVAKCPDGKLGANLHASISGTVKIKEHSIVIESRG